MDLYRGVFNWWREECRNKLQETVILHRWRCVEIWLLASGSEMDLFIYRRTTVSDALLGSGEKAMEDTNVASMELAFQWHGKMNQKRSILKKKKMLPKVNL